MVSNFITVKVLQQLVISSCDTCHTIIYHWPNVCIKTGHDHIKFNQMLHNLITERMLSQLCVISYNQYRWPGICTKYMFTKISETHCRVIIASNRQDLNLPGGKHKVLYTGSFAYSGAMIWNNLTPSICNCNNLNQFKSYFLNYYFS